MHAHVVAVAAFYYYYYRDINLYTICKLMRLHACVCLLILHLSDCVILYLLHQLKIHILHILWSWNLLSVKCMFVHKPSISLPSPSALSFFPSSACRFTGFFSLAHQPSVHPPISFSSSLSLALLFSHAFALQPILQEWQYIRDAPDDLLLMQWIFPQCKIANAYCYVALFVCLCE